MSDKDKEKEKEARRGLRSSFKLSRKLPFIKKADNASGTDEEGKGQCTICILHVHAYIYQCTNMYMYIPQYIYMCMYICTCRGFETHLRQLIFLWKSDCLGCVVLLGFKLLFV